MLCFADVRIIRKIIFENNNGSSFYTAAPVRYDTYFLFLQIFFVAHIQHLGLFEVQISPYPFAQ